MTDQTDPSSAPSALRHGGDIDGVARQYGIAPEDWLDLSTGINPQPYPLPDLPTAAWHRLPGRQAEAELLGAARAYYDLPRGADLRAVPGTQSVLQLLPQMLPSGQVDILSPTYGEHAHCWSRTDHDHPESRCPEITPDGEGPHMVHPTRPHGTPRYAASSPEKRSQQERQVREIQSITEIDTKSKIAIIVNPNNPDGKRYNVMEQLALARTLRKRGGYLILDEAFADEDPSLSCARHLPGDGMIILRSFGKFFGLAGLRLGFVLAPPPICAALGHNLGPWAVNGPALQVGRTALEDTPWQQQTRTRLATDAVRLRRLLAGFDLEIIGGTGLFCLIRSPAAPALYEHLCRDGILCRFFDDRPDDLRFGMPGPDTDWQRLEKSLLAWSERARRTITD